MSYRWQQFLKHALLIIIKFEFSLSLFRLDDRCTLVPLTSVILGIKFRALCTLSSYSSLLLPSHCSIWKNNFTALGLGWLDRERRLRSDGWRVEAFVRTSIRHEKKGCVCWGSFRGWTWGQGTVKWFCNVDVSVRTVVVNGRSRSPVRVVKGLMEISIFGNILD